MLTRTTEPAPIALHTAADRIEYMAALDGMTAAEATAEMRTRMAELDNIINAAYMERAIVERIINDLTDHD